MYTGVGKFVESRYASLIPILTQETAKKHQDTGIPENGEAQDSRYFPEDMTEKEIKITFPEAKLEALTFFLMEQNEKSVEELLKGSLDKLYEKMGMFRWQENLNGYETMENHRKD